MTDCQKLPSAIYPNRELCEWYVKKTGRTPKSLDTGETFVDLSDSLNPKTRQTGPDGKISPRELATEVTRTLEAEWRRFLAGGKRQPIAREAYDQFRFLPPWLPKPVFRMSQEEKRIYNEFLSRQETLETVGAIHSLISYVGEDGTVEDDFFGILRAGAAGCAGISNLFYFGEAIVNRERADFLEVYRDRGKARYHIAVLIGKRPYDPSYQMELEDQPKWFPLHPMDQWAASIMNTGLSMAKSGEITKREFLEKYALRAGELAPDYFRVRFNLSVAFDNAGDREKGTYWLESAQELYPVYESSQ